MIVRGNSEFIAQCDDVLIDLDGCERCSGQVCVAELGERSAAQAEQQDALWSAVEKEERHHLACVGERQPHGIAQFHHALDRAEIEMQKSPRSVVDYEWFVIGT